MLRRWDVVQTEIKRKVAKQSGKKLVIAEIGVYEGKLAYNVLSSLGDCIEQYVMVDPFVTYSGYNDSDIDVRADENLLNEALNNLKNNVLTKYDQCIFLKEKSQEAVSSFPDNYFDIIFLDANHLYEFINTDIKNWLPKVKEGGILMGHDYGYPGLDGVKMAVDEQLYNVMQMDDYVWIYNKEGRYESK